MTTQQLRNQITVTNWSMTAEMMSISYFRSYNGQSKTMHLLMKTVDYLKELNIIGSIEEIHEAPLRIFIDNSLEWCNIFQFISKYKINQWDALAIAVRHESAIELENDTNLLEMDSAIAALK